MSKWAWELRNRSGHPKHRKPLIFALFRVVSGFFGINGRDGDGGDEGHVAVNLGVAFGEGADGGQVVFLQLVGQQAEPPAQNRHVNRGTINRVSKSSKQFRIRENHGAGSPKGVFLRRERRNGRVLIAGGFLLAVVVAAIYAFALAQQRGAHADQPKFTSDLAKSSSAELAPPSHEIIPEEQALSGKTEFGQFPPYTEAEQELEKMLRGKGEDIDLALANWLIVADIPQFGDMTRERYFARLDGMTEQVRQGMAMMRRSGWRGADPKDPASRCRMFCNALIRLRFAYREEFRQENVTPALIKALYADANNTFLAGLLRTRRGSCVSMPLIYLVIGQRLGLPVHLVAIGRHYFIRWEEPGYRMNIETTIVEKVCVTPDDSVYLDTEGMRRDQLRGSDLRNLTRREVVGDLFFTRSSYWHAQGGGCQKQSLGDLSRARHLAPDDPAIQATYQAVFNRSGIKREYTSMNIKPKE